MTLVATSTTVQRCLLALSLATASTPAAAFCYQGRDVNDALQYLVCLHNEQADLLNEQARIINDHADIINRLGREIDSDRDFVQQLDQTFQTYARKVVGAEMKTDDLAETIEALTARVEELEVLLRERGIALPKEEFFWRDAKP